MKIALTSWKVKRSWGFTGDGRPHLRQSLLRITLGTWKIWMTRWRVGARLYTLIFFSVLMFTLASCRTQECTQKKLYMKASCKVKNLFDQYLASYSNVLYKFLSFCSFINVWVLHDANKPNACEQEIEFEPKIQVSSLAFALKNKRKKKQKGLNHLSWIANSS